MARRPKAPVEAGRDTFAPASRSAMQNGAQRPGDDDDDGYFAGADKDQQPAVGADKVHGGEPLDDEELGAIIQQELQDAVTFIDMEVGPIRAAATAAYRGAVGDAETGDEDAEDEAMAPAGRSSVASRDVRDTILGLLPDLMRIFTSSQDVVSFQPTNSATVDAAEQATDYANYVFMRDNEGFQNLYSVFKDALKYKVGILKIWWDTCEIVRTEHYSGIDAMGLQILEDEDEVEQIEIIKEIPVAGDGEPLVDLRVKRRIKHGRIRVEPLPPEEFIIDRRARSLKDFTICGHRSMKTVSELVALGYDEAEVRQYVTSPELDMNIEYIARQPWARTVGGFEGMNPALQKVLYVELFTRVDADGDGIAELHRICTMGPSYKIVAREPADFAEFAAFQCDPEPHTFFGESITDVTEDVQRIKTQVWRDSLDSLAQSIRPRIGIVEGQVNYDDVLNNEVGGVIRMRAPGMAQPFDTPFVGQAAFPMLEYTDSVLEKRTGVSLQSLGLDPDALQSTTKLAVQQQISGSQGRLELLARILADGLRAAFKLILNLSVMNQDRPRTIQIRQKWVQVDPRYWNADMECEIDVALGRGSAQEQIGVLMGVKQTQEQILQMLGPQNPICSLTQYSNTLRKILELSGFRNVNDYFNDVPPGAQLPQPPGAHQNPQMITAQTQQQTAQAQIQIEQQRLQLDQQKAAMDHQRLVTKDNAEMAFKQRELELKYGGKSAEAALGAMTDIHSHHMAETAANTRHAMTTHADMTAARNQTAADQQTAQRQMENDRAIAAAAPTPKAGE